MTKVSVYSELAGAPHIKPSGPTAATFTGEQGQLCGLNAAGEVVQATAAADGSGSPSASGPIAARGVLFPDHVTDLSNDSEAQAVQAAKLYKGANDTLAGEHRASLVAHGFIVQNEDQDWGFNCDQPVYLGPSGGFTQTKPSTAGQIVQAVGFPVNLDRYPAGEAVWIDVDTDYTTV